MNTYTFPVPLALNGDQLENELGALSVRVVGEDLIIDSHKTESEVAAALAAHVPIPKPQPTIEQKLAMVGLSLDDLKAALGV